MTSTTLPNLAPAAKRAVGRVDIAEREGVAHGHSDPTGGERREHVGGHVGRDVRLLAPATGAQRRAADAGLAHHELHQVDLERSAAPDADDHDARPWRHVGQHGLHAGGTDQLEHHVVGTVVTLLAGGDHGMRAQRAQRVATRRVAHSGGHPRPGHRRQLHAGRAHPAGGATDQDALAHLELGLAEEGVVGGGEGLGKAPGLGPGNRGGDLEGMGLVDAGQRGLGAAPDHAHDAVAAGEERDLAPDGHHFAGQLHARDVGW